MMEKSDISLPQNIVMTVEEKKLERMIDVALTLDPLWENALGPSWKQIMTREKIRSLYLRM